MSINVEVLFDSLRGELSSNLSDAYSKCEDAYLLSGFMTVEGIDAIHETIRNNPSKLKKLIVGAATWRAMDAFDQLIDAGVSMKSLMVHLGHSRSTRPGAMHRFYRYHPMLHSKVYLFDMPDGNSKAFVGSHNLTGYALNGLNGEASVCLEASKNDQAIKDIRAHIEAAEVEAIPYDPSQRAAYAWWFLQSVEGVADKFRDTPRDSESKTTIIILTESDGIPAQGETIYFELPEGLGRVKSLKAEVHVFFFDTLPTSPSIALKSLKSAKSSLWCRVVGIEDDRGGQELRADWHLIPSPPVLRRAPRPFRPRPAAEMQQVRVQIYNSVKSNFEYLFDDSASKYEPIFDNNDEIVAPSDRIEALQRLDLVPPEHQPWQRVKGLKPSEEAREDKYMTALRSLSPESGSFILVSTKRKTK